MTANADNRYQMLLQLAADTRRRDDTAALNITYTASVAAVENDYAKGQPQINMGHLSLSPIHSPRRSYPYLLAALAQVSWPPCHACRR